MATFYPHISTSALLVTHNDIGGDNSSKPSWWSNFLLG